MVKRTIGFNWGAAGLGMSEWGGCHLADVLAAHGVSTDPATWDDGRHVCFWGPDKELPAGADGSYGTSLDDAAAGARHLHLLLRAAAHDQERHRQARGPGPRPVARPLLLDRSSPNHMMDIAAQNPLKISPALFPPSKDASFIAVAAPTASSPAGTPSTRTIRTPPPRAYDNLQTIRLLNPKPRSPPTTPRSPRSRRPARRRSMSPLLRCPLRAR